MDSETSVDMPRNGYVQMDMYANTLKAIYKTLTISIGQFD